MRNLTEHRTPIQIRFKDVDKMGHVNNANHATYLELARMMYFEEEVAVKIDWTKKGVILAKVQIDFLVPIQLEDKVSVLTSCSRVGNKSFELSHVIVRTENGKDIELAKGISVVVCFDYEKNVTIPVPELWKEKLLRNTK